MKNFKSKILLALLIICNDVVTLDAAIVTAGEFTINVINQGTCARNVYFSMFEGDILRSSQFATKFSGAGSEVASTIQMGGTFPTAGTEWANVMVGIGGSTTNMMRIYAKRIMDGPPPGYVGYVFEGTYELTIGSIGNCTTNSCVSTNYILKFSVKNNTQTYIPYQLMRGGANGEPMSGGQFTVFSGETVEKIFTVRVPCGTLPSDYALYTIGPSEDGGNYYNIDENGKSVDMNYHELLPPAYPPSEIVIDPSDMPPDPQIVSTNSIPNIAQSTNRLDYVPRDTNSVIFSSTNSEVILAQGFNALFDAISEGGAGTQAELKKVRESEKASAQSITNKLGEIGDLLSKANGTNASKLTSLTNLTTAGNRTLTGMSNLLQTIAGNTNGTSGGTNVSDQITHEQLAYLTNLFGGSSTNSRTLSGSSENTNYSASLASGTAAVGDGITSVDGFLGGFGSGTPTWTDGGGVGPSGGFQIEMGAHTLNFDPDVIAPGSTTWLRNLIKFLMLAAFTYSCAQLFYKTAQTFATAQTGGVPAMQLQLLGFGGNVLGTAVAVVIPVIFIALWVGLFTLFFSLLASSIVSNFMATADLTAPSVVAADLLWRTFPVETALSLISSRIVLHFTMAKAMMIAAAASRFLFGK